MLSWPFTLTIFEQFLLVYLIGINVVAFLYFGIDKLKAKYNKPRISERMLWFLSAIGGWLGSLVGMKIFRHKTKKLSFQTMMVVIITIHLVILTLVFLSK